MNEFRIFRAFGLGFKACAVNFVPFVLIAAVLYSPAVWLTLNIDMEKARTDEGFTKVVIGLPLLLVMACSLFLTPLVTYRVIQHLNGTTASIWTSMRYGLRGVLPALIFAVTAGLLFMLPFGWLGAPIVACLWFVGTPAAVAEDLGAFAALGRSNLLTVGRRWHIFGMIVLMCIGAIALLMATVFALRDPETLEAARNISFAVLGVMGVFQMFCGVVQAVSYALLRQDKEGVSNAELARIFD